MNQCPTIETPRLTLRGHNIDDLSAAITLWSDPLVVRHTIGKPSTRQDVWSRLLRYAGHWSMLGYGYWAVEEKATGHFIGELGFADFKRNLEPSIEGYPELGWALISSHHGQGLATEALLAVIAWGETQLKAKKAFCIINTDNYASLRVAEKCGYKEVHRTIYNHHPIVLLERYKTDEPHC